MANWVQDMSYSNRSESLSDCIALESPRPLVSRYSNLRTNSRVQPAKMAKVSDPSSREYHLANSLIARDQRLSTRRSKYKYAHWWKRRPGRVAHAEKQEISRGYQGRWQCRGRPSVSFSVSNCTRLHPKAYASRSQSGFEGSWNSQQAKRESFKPWFRADDHRSRGLS